ncbi:FAD-dependent oxidoreductase [Nonomuraea cypriaca]|uniref:FAD-dependent oxidoreductase n=1 Tax=Nonomuraea cypriaca TaxID=1187855 RepID=UPI002E2C3ADC|nr:FAD-dependent oxidoreductase [Nonomuraea cypriaca]
MAGDAGRVVVVGAGIAGLTAAHRLAGAGIEVTVLEAGRRPGPYASRRRLHRPHRRGRRPRTAAAGAGRVADTRVVRWNQAMPSVPVGHARAVMAYRSEVSPAEAVLLAGDYLGFPWTDSAAFNGRGPPTGCSPAAVPTGRPLGIQSDRPTTWPASPDQAPPRQQEANDRLTVPFAYSSRCHEGGSCRSPPPGEWTPKRWPPHTRATKSLRIRRRSGSEP